MKLSKKGNPRFEVAPNNASFSNFEDYFVLLRERVSPIFFFFFFYYMSEGLFLLSRESNPSAKIRNPGQLWGEPL